MSVFNFKHFSIKQSNSPMKVGTDAMLLGSLINVTDSKSVLDVGAGTGVIGLMLAQRIAEARITAVELDALSAEECHLNFEQSPWANRLEVVTGDFLAYQPNNTFDLIVSNPPYFRDSLTNENERIARARHAFSLPEADFLQHAKAMLAQNGKLYVIVPYTNLELWMKAAETSGLMPVEMIKIHGVEGGECIRAIIGWSTENSSCQTSRFTIRQTDGKYTQAYIERTREFHDRIPS